MRSRRKAREAALQALYQCDTLDDWSAECVELYFKIYKSELCDKPVDTLPPNEAENIDFARSLINGVIEHMDFVDAQISGASTNWSIGRMCRVDRNILRFATFELAFLDDIPKSVTINEAIEIAKAYGTPDSPNFINGVLDNIAGSLERDPKMPSRPAPQRVGKLAANG